MAGLDKCKRKKEAKKEKFCSFRFQFLLVSFLRLYFDPTKIDLKDPKNYSVISPNLFRVQKFSKGDYMFRHYLETTVKNESKEMKDILYKRITSLKQFENMVKVRVNHIGEIVDVGEK